MQEYFHRFNDLPNSIDGDMRIMDEIEEVHMYVGGEWIDITDDFRGPIFTAPLTWKEKFGTPPPTKRSYVSRKTCGSFWSWLCHSWCFINAQGYREVGRRFLGRETIYYFVIPRGELRF